MQHQLSVSDILSALSSGEGVLTHVRTACYFTAFLGALSCTLVHFPWARAWREKPVSILSGPYALVALLATWRLILIFMVGFQAQFASHPDPPNLFVEAYVLVSDSAAGWWWSSMLLTWVSVACPMVATEAMRRRMPNWLALAHVVVGFLGAVSVGFPLLLAHLSLLAAAPTTARSTASDPLWSWCVGASLLSIVVLPSAVSGARAQFIGALVVVHVVLVVPFCRSVRAGDGQQTWRGNGSLTATGYVALAVVTFLLHIRASVAAYHELAAELVSGSRTSGSRVPVSELAAALLAASARNVCQMSISIDAVMASIAGGAYMLSQSGIRALLLCCAAPIISPASALALHEAAREAGHIEAPHIKQ